MDCYVCITCANIFNTYHRFCRFCNGEKTIELDRYGMTRRLLINILGTITREQLQEMATITGCGPVTHEQLFKELKEGLK